MAEEHKSEDHIVPVGTYVVIFLSLLVLTGTTYLAATIDLGDLNIVVALLIACVKASLVAFFFMHLKYSHKVMRLVLFGSVFWLLILIALSMNDYLTRGLRYPGVGPH